MAVLDRTFDTYYLERRLGGGGMGEVYLARAADGRRVALKLVEIGADADSLDIVAAERVGAGLQQQFGEHDPHVPAVYRFGEAAGHFFIEMELVEGADLAERIARGLPPKEAVRIAAEVAAFLEGAHHFSAQVAGREFRGLVHADLKPKNIRLTADGRVKVLDFGISKGLSLTGRLTTAAFGSRSYMSPEWVDTGRLDHHVDLWALGVVLYEMLAGRLPFRTESARQLELALLARTPPLPLPDSCPEALRHIVYKALAPDLSRRYPSAATFRADLVAWNAGEPTVAATEWSAGHDVEATRRTRRPDAPTVDPEATRRTSPAAAPGSDATIRTRGDNRADAESHPNEATAGLSGPPAAPGPHATAAERGSPANPAAIGSHANAHRRRRVRVAVYVVAFLVLVNEYRACRSAAALRAELPTRQEGQIEDTWNRYESVRGRSWLGLASHGLSDPMVNLLVTHAERVISDFRHERPTVRERQWEQARGWLAQASHVEPSNPTILARLRYCEGHLARIDGEARLKEGRRPQAERSLHDAVARFEEAARLDRSWPDPWLGLLRTELHGLENVERGVEALNEAERRGHRAGRREHMQVGEAYQIRGERARRECDRVPDDQRCVCLQRAAASYRQAISWFARAAGSPETSRALSRADAALEGVTDRMFESACSLEGMVGTDRP